MSWMAKLYETYEKGVMLDLPLEDKLMPISHTLQNAHINIAIDGNGNFKRASVLEKKIIVLPATEQSAGRSGKLPPPHPLSDKLQYVAADYPQFGGQKPSFFANYKELLSTWCKSEFLHPKAQAIYYYIEKGQVIADLIKAQIVHVDNANILLTSWPINFAQEAPLLFKVLPKEKGQLDQGAALVCWTVEMDGILSANTWEDISLQQSWIEFDASIGSKKGLCYITGNEIPLAVNHPTKLRHSGDKAKLISANDSSGYTYRGKFISDTEAGAIGFEVTQKAHNALRWLLSRQGYRNGEQAIVAWAVSGKSIPKLTDDSYKLLDWDDLDEIESTKEIDENINIDHCHDLGQSFALKLNKKMAGYRAELSDLESVVIMAIDSATPGRMGITYYREYFAKEFIERLESWHLDFSWQQRHSKNLQQDNGKKAQIKVIWPISAPAPYVIADAAYGKTLTDSLKKNLHERLIPCILEGQPPPIDIVNACVQRASNPSGSEYWEWERNLGVACALYRGFYRRHPTQTKRRDYLMTLETNNNSRDYLYGRLLAIAERIEKVALSITDEKRMTTAERLMQRFADRPYSTWRNIELALKPYIQRLQSRRPGFVVNRQKELDKIMSAFKGGEFTYDKKLSGEFLLAYHCQRQNSRNEQESLLDSDTAEHSSKQEEI